MRKLVAALIVVGVGVALCAWRISVNRPEPLDKRVEAHSRPRGTEAPGGVFIPARGELWSRDVEDAIRAVGTNALPSLLTLITQRQDNAKTDWVVAGAGFDALGSNAAPAVPALIEFMDDARPAIREMAVECLASIGPSASNAVPKLLAILSGTDKKAQRSALAALSHIGGDPDLLVPAFVAYLDGPHDTNHAASEQVAALWALKPYAENSPAALSAFRRMTNASSLEVRVRADQLLWQIEHPPRPRQPGEPDTYRGGLKQSP